MVTIADTTAIANAFATSVAPDIDNVIDISTVVAAAINTAVDIVSEIVVVAIVEPQVRFPAGAPSVCLTCCQLQHSANGALCCALGQVYTISSLLPDPTPLQFTLWCWNKNHLPTSSCIW